MDLVQLIQFINALVAAGKATYDEIEGYLRAGQLSEPQLNDILDGIKADAERRQAIADADSVS